jgi:hypothetical protein
MLAFLNLLLLVNGSTQRPDQLSVIASEMDKMDVFLEKARTTRSVVGAQRLLAERLFLESQFLNAYRFLDEEMPSFSFHHLTAGVNINLAVSVLSDLRKRGDMDEADMLIRSHEIGEKAIQAKLTAEREYENLLSYTKEVRNSGNRILELIKDFIESYKIELTHTDSENESSQMYAAEIEAKIFDLNVIYSDISETIVGCNDMLD